MINSRLKNIQKNKIFISYKKIETKPGGLLRSQRDVSTVENARFVAGVLQSKGYPVYFDVDLKPGHAWPAHLATEVLTSEVLVVMLRPGAMDSHWVRSEVVFANAFGVSIVPIGCGMTAAAAEQEISQLGLGFKQVLTTDHFTPGSDPDALWADFKECLDENIATTRDLQKQFFVDAQKTREHRAVATSNQSHAKFSAPTQDGTPVSIHIASGNFLEFRDLDIIVNSENNHMQMARLIDGRTVSGSLREGGACKAPRFDSMQRELDLALDEWSQANNAPPPAPIGQVIVTSSGHPQGNLRKINGCRYVFHVSTAEIRSNGELHSMSNSGQIREAVHNCFDKIKELKLKNGVISPENTSARRAQEEEAAQGRHNLDSILFPLFGSGRGGLNIRDASRLMAQEIKYLLSGLSQEELSGLRHIYVSVFFEDDLNPVAEIFDEVFTLPNSEALG